MYIVRPNAVAKATCNRMDATDVRSDEQPRVGCGIQIVLSLNFVPVASIDEATLQTVVHFYMHTRLPDRRKLLQWLDELFEGALLL
jgi:hypothetical protein